MYTRLITDVNNFLRPHYITVNSSNIFEDTLLKMAGAKQEAQDAHMSGIAEDLMSFELIGIDNESAEKFLSLLAESDNATSCASENDVYEFVTSVDGVYNALLPKFKEAVLNLKENNPEKYQEYQTQCENDNSIQEYKLFEDIEKGLDQINQDELNEFDKGEYHVIHENLKEMVKLHQEHYSHQCGALDKLLNACSLFLKVAQDNENLRNQEAIKRTTEKLKEFLMLSIAREQYKKLANALRSLLEAEILEATPMDVEILEATPMDIDRAETSMPRFGMYMNLFQSSSESSSSGSDSDSENEMEMEVEEEILSSPSNSPRR